MTRSRSADNTAMEALLFPQSVSLDLGTGGSCQCHEATPYVFIDYNAQELRRQLPQIKSAPLQLPRPYLGELGSTSNLVIHWVAGLGDTIALIPALNELSRAYPAARIDVVAPRAHYALLRLGGFKGGFVPYPAVREVIQQYDFIAALEHQDADPRAWQMDGVDFFGELLHRTTPLRAPRLMQTPEPKSARVLAPSNRPRIGVQVKGLSPLRTYPFDLLSEVLKGLVKQEFEVYLFGLAGDCDIASAPPLINNLCGATSSIEELAYFVAQMNCVIAPDSLLMHMGAALEIPTVALLSTVPAELRVSKYPHVVPLMPEADCSPCRISMDNACPLGHLECVALRGHATSPAEVLSAVSTLTADLTGSKHPR